MTRTLVASWCSFDEVIATVGDDRAVEVVSGWLADDGVPHDVAWAGYLERDIPLHDVDPTRYSHLVFVCGPLLSTPLLTALLDRFTHARRIAVGVSVVDTAVAARFDDVLARDGAGVPTPDLAGVTAPAAGPVVAVVHAPTQPEYGPDGRHDQVRARVAAWLSSRRLGWFEVETDLLTGDHPTRHAGQVVAALARADVVVSSRLHGLVLGLAAGRPVVAVDPVAGGAKVTAQAAALGWPVVVAGNGLDAAVLDSAVDLALDRPVPASSGRAVAAAVESVRRHLEVTVRDVGS